ncbi:MAG: hypothetical protein R3336_08130 [Phycisphaeraceae bacterium]|nr:hypothetical protein [Phycisphaeraceae bacterium]
MKQGQVLMLVGGGMLLLALAVPALVIVPMFMGGSRQPFLGPGTHTFAVDEPQTWSIRHVYETTFNGKRYAHPQDLPADFDFEVVPAGGGQPLTLTEDTSLQVSSSGQKWTRVATFEPPAAGDYELRVTGTSSDRVLTVGPLFLSGLGAAISSAFGAVASGCFMGVVGLVMLIAGGVIVAREPAPVAESTASAPPTSPE